MIKITEKYIYDKENHNIYNSDTRNININININIKKSTDKKWVKQINISKKKEAAKVVLVMTGSCNLSCDYCYAGQGAYGKEHMNRIDFTQLHKTMIFLEERFPNGIRDLQFFGGEPLLEPKAIEYVCDYFINSVSFSKTNFTMVTNGTVTSDKIIELLQRFNIKVTVSLDGTKNIHNEYRTFKNNGEGTFDLVKKNIKSFTESSIYVSLQLTITDKFINEYDMGVSVVNDIINIMKELNVSYLHLCPVILPEGDKHNLNNNQRNILLKIQNEFIFQQNNSNIIETSKVQTINFLKNKVCKEGYCGAGIKEMTIDVNGDIYPCFMFINNKNLLLGSIYQGFTNMKILEILEQNIKSNNKKCSVCNIKDNCNMCIGANLIQNKAIDINSDLLCKFKENGYFKNIECLLNSIENKI